MNELLARVHEAHVQHELSRWRGDAIASAIAGRVNALFRWFEEVKLDEVVTRSQVLGVIDRYVVELRVSGGITELSGEMSQLVITSRVSAETRLDQILTPELYAEFADKVLSLESVRRELIHLIAKSSSAAAISARLAARGLLDVIALTDLPALPGLPAFAAKLRKLLLPTVERRLAEALARYVGRNRERLADDAERHMLEVLDPERLRSVVDDLWDSVSALRLSEVFAFVGEQDIEDFVVLVYEFWLRYRKTDFFRRIAGELVDFFFSKYGQESLLALIEDMGVTEGMVSQELVSLLGPAVEHAARSGALERQIRARLEGFYRSPAAQAALEQPVVAPDE